MVSLQCSAQGSCSALFNRVCIVLLMVLFFGTRPAWAHGSFPGSEGFVLGLAHPVLEPLQGLLAGAFGVLLARTRAHNQVHPLLVYVASVLIAGVTVFVWPELSPTSLALLAMTLVVSVSTAGFKSVPIFLTFFLAAFSGLAIGSNAISMIGEGRLPTSLGSLIGGIVFPIYFYGPANWLYDRETKHPWFHLVPRVLAAWVAAVCIMMIAFVYRSLAA